MLRTGLMPGRPPRSPRRRTRTVDLILFGTVAIASFMSGVVYNEWGWEMLNWVVFPVVVVCIVALYALRVMSRNAGRVAIGG